MDPVLVVLAAGMGSRFGGMKQMTPVDDDGRFIIDYSLHDAYHAGFRRVAFVIKREMETAFRQSIGRRAERDFQVSYVFQELSALPEGYSVPAVRKKPWGTAHAVACCRGVVDAPFAVINADDFYGRRAYETVYRFLTQDCDAHTYAMVGYRLRNTVTPFGSVARGICTEKGGFLTSVTERTKIFQRGEDAAFTEDGKTFFPLPGNTIVSMNFFAFHPRFLDEIWSCFPTFLDENLPRNPEKCELYLPDVVTAELEAKTARVRLLPCDEVWHGVTYHDDLPSVVSALAALRQQGLYPAHLRE